MIRVGCASSTASESSAAEAQVAEAQREAGEGVKEVMIANEARQPSDDVIAL